MNEELQKAIAQMVEKANSGIDGAASFLSAEMPEYIQQLLMWHAVSSFALFAFGVGIVISSAVGIYKSIKITGRGEGHKEFLAFLAFLPSLVGFAICANNSDWLKIWIAPKVWLVEYAAGLVK